MRGGQFKDIVVALIVGTVEHVAVGVVGLAAALGPFVSVAVSRVERPGEFIFCDSLIRS